MTEPKCCGNCRWWDKREDIKPHEIGDCRPPLPVSLVNTETKPMFADYGTNCPCHEMKGSGDGE